MLLCKQTYLYQNYFKKVNKSLKNIILKLYNLISSIK